MQIFTNFQLREETYEGHEGPPIYHLNKLKFKIVQITLALMPHWMCKKQWKCSKKLDMSFYCSCRNIKK